MAPSRGSVLVLTVVMACGAREPTVDRVETTATPPPVVAAPGTQVAVGQHGAVTSAEAQATQIGIDVLAAGGNAVDAAVAVGFALAVSHPTAGNLGGGGFMVVRAADGTATTFDFREVAPGAATRDMFVGPDGEVTRDSTDGPLAAGIPGTVAGFALAHRQLGHASWASLVAPARALAEQGPVLDDWHAAELTDAVAELDGMIADAPPALRPALAYTRALWQPGSTPLAIGARWPQPELAAVLARIETGGADGFYRGATGIGLADGVAAMGGRWTAADLAGYRAVERAPIEFDHGAYHVVTMPPPSAGGITLRQIFAAAETLELAALPWDSVARLHLYVEALRRVFADRSFAVADPDVIDVPVATLTDPAYVAGRMAGIDRAHATPSSSIGAGVAAPPHESPQTTHYSVVDAAGMAVAVTYTLNGNFGAHVAVPGTGVLLNNEMDDFTAKVGAPNMFGLVQGPQNAIAPGKRMVSSMTPTIVSERASGALRVVCGSPGGPTIITTVAQILLQVLDGGRTLDAAIAAPRVHHQWLPDEVRHEAALDPALAAGLVALGHTLAARDRIGDANCIERDPTTGSLRAVADVARGGGAAAAR